MNTDQKIFGNWNRGAGNLLMTILGLLLMTLPGCKTTHAPMKNTIINRIDSPDRKLSALLVERHYKAALSNDQFYLLILSDGQDANKAINNNDIADSSALVATLAGKVQLHWQDKNTLFVICGNCGLEAVDISKKLDRIGSIKIVYKGFPEHTAYS